MNNGQLIKKHFDFLRMHNFTRKQFTNGSDYEMHYEKQGTKICVMVSWSIPNEIVAHYIQGNHYVFPADFDRDKFIKDINFASHLMAGVIIDITGKRQDLLACSLFEATDLSLLAEDIKNCGRDYEKQLVIYSDFMKNNLDKLNIN